MEQYVSASDLALILKITARRVSQLAAEGTIFREENGKFDIAKSVENFYRKKFHTDEKREIDFDMEHALYEKAKRKKAELDLQKYQGQLLDAKEVEHAMSGMILTCKARLLNIPIKVAPKVVGEGNMSVIVEKIKDAVFEALEELHQMPAAEILEADDAVDT